MHFQYAFLMAPRFSEICIFPWENAYFWKILEPSKMHIENAYFLRAIKNAYWKCIFFACYFYGRSKMHNGSGRPTFLICTVSPKAVLWRFFSACFSLRHLNVTQQVWQQILIPALQSQLEPSVPYSGTQRHGSPWSQFYPDLGGFDLWAETTQYGRGAGCDCKFLGHLHVSLNTYSIYHAW